MFNILGGTKYVVFVLCLLGLLVTIWETGRQDCAGEKAGEGLEGLRWNLLSD